MQCNLHCVILAVLHFAFTITFAFRRLKLCEGEYIKFVLIRRYLWHPSSLIVDNIACIVKRTD